MASKVRNASCQRTQVSWPFAAESGVFLVHAQSGIEPAPKSDPVLAYVHDRIEEALAEQRAASRRHRIAAYTERDGVLMSTSAPMKIVPVHRPHTFASWNGEED